MWCSGWSVLNSPFKRIGLFFVAVTLFGGCKTIDKPGYVQEQWTNTMRELGIYPVFPPRADVVVGDLYLLPADPFDKEQTDDLGELEKLGLWVHTYETSASAEDFYSKRPFFETSPNAFEKLFEATSTVSIWREPARTGSGSTFSATDTSRLRQVGFPQFSSTRFQNVSLAAMLPVEALNVALGLNLSKGRNVYVKIPSASSYGLPLSAFLKKATPEANTQNSSFDDLLRMEPNQMLRLAVQGGNPLAPPAVEEAEPGQAGRTLSLLLVTEVFYTRAVDITIEAKSSFGSAANVQPTVIGSIEKVSTSTETPANAAGAAVAPPQVNSGSTTTTTRREVYSGPLFSRTDDAYARAGKLNTWLKDTGNQTIPGGSIQFLSVADTGIGARTIYDQPMAYGVRGAILKVNLDTFTVAGLGNAVNTRNQGIAIAGAIDVSAIQQKLQEKGLPVCEVPPFAEQKVTVYVPSALEGNKRSMVGRIVSEELQNQTGLEYEVILEECQ